jgi:cellulose synthase/poly-beta-1,6-N-acetylglucosamine synthase-like glycosyltransferase
MINKINCSLGVIVYNEVQNISRLLDAVLTQDLNKVNLKEIIVVSSASIDGTDEVVKDYAKKYPKIKLISEKERNGKSTAINLFIKNATSDILIIESGDTIPGHDTIEKMILPFENQKIGMTGGRPKPINSTKNMVGFSVNLLWRLHHKMALINPKLGEMIAFRKCFERIPTESAVDEASIEAEIKARNLEKKYIPDATIINKGPENITDFLLQRRRISAGHYWLMKTKNYKVTSLNSGILMKITLQEIFSNPMSIHKIFFTMILEITGRILGWYDFYIKKKNPYKWDIASSTKNLN